MERSQPGLTTSPAARFASETFRSGPARGRTGVVLLGVVLSLACGGAAWAQAPVAGGGPDRPHAAARPRPTPWWAGVSAAERARALSLFKQGMHAHVRLRYSRAIRLYRRALAHWNHPAIQYNLTVCYVNTDRPLQAHRAVRAALRYGRGPLTEAQHRQALEYRKMLGKRLSRITVTAAQAGVKVTLDGKPLFTGPGTRTELVLPGKHMLVGAKPKHVTLSRKVVVFSGRTVRVAVRLVSIADMLKKRKIVYRRRWSVWKPWVVFGAGAALAAVGVPLLLKARSDVSAFDTYVNKNCADGCDESSLPSSELSGKEGEKVLSGLSIGLMVAGGAALAAGVVLLVMNRARAVTVEAPGPDAPKPASPRVQLLPAFGPGGASLTARLRF